ncbi:hypothetical protein IC582_028407 [Cucumis melo]
MTSVHENWFCARCMNTIKHAGKGVIIVQTTAFILIAISISGDGSGRLVIVGISQEKSLVALK